jgi:hypothetical protein
MAGAPQIKYRPLARGNEHEIRLLHLEPRSSSMPSKAISCHFSYAYLEDNPVYEALSYMWGREQPCGIIVVDGTSCKVRKNLWLALKRLRLHDDERVLWVDALCIDQDTPDERNHQVSQMGQIYSQARRVCVWIHPDQPVFRHIPQPKKPAGIESTSSWLTYEAVHEICHQSYWSRLWIIQELVLATDIQIYFGNLTARWTAFSTRLHGLGYNTRSHDLMTAHLNISDTTPAKILRLSDTSVDKILKPIEHTLIHLMIMNHSARCAHSLDKAYALLSLAAPCCQNAVPVDYEKSVYDLWSVLLAHHLSIHSAYATTIDNVPTTIQGFNRHADSQRIKQATTIRNLISAQTPLTQCVQLEAEFTALFSMSDGMHFNGIKGETIKMIGNILGPVYFASPQFGQMGHSLKPTLEIDYAFEILHGASNIMEQLDQGLSRHNISNLVTVPGQRPHSTANFSSQLDFIQEISSSQRTSNRRFVNGAELLNGYPPVWNPQTKRVLADLAANSTAMPLASFESDFLTGLLDLLDSMVVESCSPNPCVLALEKNGKSVLAPPNTQIGVICKLESSSIYLVLRPHGLQQPTASAGTDEEDIARDALLNSNLYTIVGRAISLFSSDPNGKSSSHGKFSSYKTPLVNIYVDAPALQILTRCSTR